MARCTPKLIGENLGQPSEYLSRRELLLKGLLITGLITIVLGGIYAGFFTPVEAGAIGSVGALCIGLAKGSLKNPYAKRRDFLVDFFRSFEALIGHK